MRDDLFSVLGSSPTANAPGSQGFNREMEAPFFKGPPSSHAGRSVFHIGLLLVFAFIWDQRSNCKHGKKCLFPSHHVSGFNLSFLHATHKVLESLLRYFSFMPSLYSKKQGTERPYGLPTVTQLVSVKAGI